MLYFVLAYSDPGYLSDDKEVNSELDAKVIKSLEEVYYTLMLEKKKERRRNKLWL